MTGNAELNGVNGRISSYFVWEVEQKPISILFNLDVLDHIRNEVIQGFATVPKRGLEVGGILLGRCEQMSETHRIVTIEGFKTVESEHLQGPHYNLSDHDRQELEKQLTNLRLADDQTLRPIGFYRSHTREGLQLQPEDIELFETYFGDPSSIFLVIKPSLSKGAIAGFFFWENGALQWQCYREFPLQRRELEAAGFQVIQNPFAQPIVNTPPPAAPVSTLQPSNARQRRFPAWLGWKPSTSPYWLWAPLLLALLILAVPWAWHKPAPQTPVTAARFGSAADLHLSAERLPNGLRLSWDRNNPAIENARNGVLWIRDGKLEKRLDLDHRQLTSGSLIYWPTSSDVNFRMDVSTAANNVSESLLAYSGGPPPQASVPETSAKPSVVATYPMGRETDRRQTRSRLSDSRLPDGKEANSNKPSPVVAAPSTEAPAVASIEPPHIEHENGALTPPPIHENISVPLATVSVEPVQESVFRRAVQTVPGLRLLQRHRYKGGDRFTPAKAVRESTPRVPRSVARDLRQETPVDLRLHVEQNGSISQTELTSDTKDKRLVGLAAEAAKHWRFEPARIGDKPVASKVVLHFLFRPATLVSSRQ